MRGPANIMVVATLAMACVPVSVPASASKPSPAYVQRLARWACGMGMWTTGLQVGRRWSEVETAAATKMRCQEALSVRSPLDAATSAPHEGCRLGVALALETLGLRDEAEGAGSPRAQAAHASCVKVVQFTEKDTGIPSEEFPDAHLWIGCDKGIRLAAEALRGESSDVATLSREARAACRAKAEAMMDRHRSSPLKKQVAWACGIGAVAYFTAAGLEGEWADPAPSERAARVNEACWPK
jgi:hypothetical protein